MKGASTAGRDVALDLIKWLALLTMLLDHLRAVWWSVSWLYVPGRFAFPFFCLAIAANLLRQRSHGSEWRYLALMALFSLLSEWPYRLLMPEAHSLNVMPTLALGLLVARAWVTPTRLARIMGFVALLFAAAVHDWLQYGLAGVLLPAAFLLALSNRHPALALLPVLGCLVANYWPQVYVAAMMGDRVSQLGILASAAAPLVGLALHRWSCRIMVPPVGRWAYGFYPAHLLALAAVERGLS